MNISHDHDDQFDPEPADNDTTHLDGPLCTPCVVCGAWQAGSGIACDGACTDELWASSEWVTDPLPSLPRPSFLARLISVMRPHRDHAAFLDTMEAHLHAD